MILSEVPLKSQTLSGKIKAADVRIEKLHALVEERRAALKRAEDDLSVATKEASDLRAERDQMAAEVAQLIGQVGEPTVAAGEEVSISAGDGSGDAAPASCEHANGFSFIEFEDAYQCHDCQELVSSACLEDRGISAVRRVVLR